MPQFFWFCLFELLLGFIALGLMQWFLSPASFPVYHWGWHEAWLTAVLLLPLLGLAFVATSRWGSALSGLREIKEWFKASPLVGFLVASPWHHFAVVSLCAGVGEELLFRGFLQPQFGLIVASVAFGVVHFMNWTYFVIATAMGFYLGWIYMIQDSNIVLPMVIHGGYDFVALLLYRRRLRQEVEVVGPDEPSQEKKGPFS